MFSSSTLNHFNGYIMLWPVSGSIVRLADFSIRVLIKDIMKTPCCGLDNTALTCHGF
jgi:hypothetical protein